MHSDRSSFLRTFGIEPAARVWIGGNDFEARGKIGAIVGSLRAVAGSRIDCAFVTPLEAEEAAYFAKKLILRLVPGATIWVTCRVNEPDKIGAICSALAGAGFVEFSRVALLSGYTTIGFHQCVGQCPPAPVGEMTQHPTREQTGRKP